MNINFKTRAELKNFFKKNAIPTAGNFADFIDAGVNQKDDGLLKPAGEPLSLEASLAASKPAIRFYETFVGNTNPSWVVSLVEPVSQQSAFVLSDALGNTRLWIAQTGAVTAPGALTVGSLAAGAVTTTSLTTTGLISATAGVNVSGAGLNVGASGNPQPLTVWGVLTANSTATVTGLLTANGGVTTTGTINTATLTATGSINANGGLTVPSGKTLTSNGQINAGAGIVVTAAGTFGVLVGSQGNPIALTTWGATTAVGGLTVGTVSVPQPLTVNGAIFANGGITANQAITINGPLNVSGTSSAIAFSRRNLVGSPPPAAGDRYEWYNPDGVARLWTVVNGDLLTVKANGFVGFGISDPVFRLDVIGRVRLHPDAIWPASGGSAGIWLTGQGSSTSNTTNERAFIGMLNDLTVGIYGNTGTAGWRLFVNTTNGNLNIGGSVATKVGGATTWVISSDARLKQNIGPLNNALDRLLQLRGATYEWREPETQGNETGPQIGFIGQQVETVFPEWIMENDDGYKLLSIRGFEALAVEALRELRAENQALKQSHEELQAQIARLAVRSQTEGGAP